MTDIVVIASVNFVAQNDTNMVDPSEASRTFTDEEITARAHGSKIKLVSEQMQCLTIWLVKACILLMYHRLTYVVQKPYYFSSFPIPSGTFFANRPYLGSMSLSQNRAVKGVAIYVGASFMVMEILYLGVWCRPFTEYWAVPPENSESYSPADTFS